MLRFRQIQAIVEKLQGIESVVIRPGDLDEPWETIYEWVGWDVGARTLERELRAATEGLPTRRRPRPRQRSGNDQRAPTEIVRW